MLHTETVPPGAAKTNLAHQARGQFTPVLNAMCEWGGAMPEEMGMGGEKKVVRKD